MKKVLFISLVLFVCSTVHLGYLSNTYPTIFGYIFQRDLSVVVAFVSLVYLLATIIMIEEANR